MNTNEHESEENYLSIAGDERFGVRWQSAAATPLSRVSVIQKRRGAPLPAAVHTHDSHNSSAAKNSVCTGRIG